MTRFLQGTALFFHHPVVARNGRRVAFDPAAFSAIADRPVKVCLDHAAEIAEGRLLVRPHAVFYECEIDDATAESLRQLMVVGKLRGSSFNVEGIGSERCDKDGVYDFVEQVEVLHEVGPVMQPADWWTTCTISSTSIMPAASAPVARKRQRIELRTMPKAMVNGMRALAAMQAGEDCILNGRTIGHGALVTMFQNRGPMAIC